MGITGLTQLILDVSPNVNSYDKLTLKDYSGKIIALDAFQYLYQSMSQGRFRGSKTSFKKDNTSPLIRTFYSTIKLLENGIKPLYVFDGRPPKLKSKVLKVRAEKRKEATIEFEAAEKKGDKEAMEIIRPRVVRVEKETIKDCRGLLKLMGIPYFFAPSEAEAQCAAFVETGRVYATATQDIDALTYGSKVVLRHLPLKTNSKWPMQELRLDSVLENLQMSLSQFVDLSILLGCDYCSGIDGLGTHRAVELIHQYQNIETILEKVDRKMFNIPDDWLFKEAREEFLNPRVISCENVSEFRWRKPDEDAVVKYLFDQSEFNEKIIRSKLQSLPNL